MRKSVLIAVIALIVVFALGITIYAVTRPADVSADDPLARRSYANGEYSQTVLKDASSSVDSSLRPIYDAALEAAQSAAPAADTSARHALTKGGSIELSEGASIILVSGAAQLDVSAGAVSDVTDGASAADGDMTANHRYIVCSGGKAAVSASERSVFVTAGGAKVAAGEIVPVNFADVKSGDWYYGADGKVTLKADGDIWYMSYVKYAVSEGIIEGSYAGKTTKEYSSPVTRAEFVHIMHGALPDEAYTVKNSVADGSIPDVKAADEYADDIYAFYRAGILTGDKAHKFGPSGTIKRSEAAVIMANMLDPGLRQSVTLK